jgi:hypothetical protein
VPFAGRKIGLLTLPEVQGPETKGQFTLVFVGRKLLSIETELLLYSGIHRRAKFNSLHQNTPYVIAH